MMTRTDLIEKLVTTLPAWPSPADHCSQPAPTKDGHREGWEKGPQDNQWHYSLIADHGGRISVTREQWEGAMVEKLQRLDHIGQNGGTGEHYPESKASNPKDALGAGKLPLHLWPATATAHGSLALMDGALKYGRTNWRPAGVRASTYVSASMRHLNAWFEGEDLAPDSGLSHLAHALAGLAILIDAEDAGMMTDDRMIHGGYLNAIDKLTPEVARLIAKHADKHPHHYTIQDADQ